MSVAATQKIAVELRMKQFRWLSEETPHVYTDLGDVEKDKVGAALHKAVSDSAACSQASAGHFGWGCGMLGMRGVALGATE